MPDDSETDVKRTAHFSWSWRSNCLLLCEVKQGAWSMLHNHCRVYPTVIVNALSVICREVSRLVHGEEETGCLMNVLQQSRWGAAGAAPRGKAYFPPMSFFPFSSFFF